MGKSNYSNFVQRLGLLIAKHPELITTVLSNIFTMRLIGNKTHGDLAEIAIAEFINQYMYDFKSETGVPLQMPCNVVCGRTPKMHLLFSPASQADG